MPRLKQPISLQKLAFNFLVEQCVNYCDTLSFGGYLTRLRQSVFHIKHYVYDHVPVTVFEEFSRKFLEKFHQIGVGRPPIERPASHHRAALEMIMDVRITGLILEGYIVNYFDPYEAPRVHGLKILNWVDLFHHQPMVRGLRNFNLQDLTTFIFPINCTDDHLRIIASQCSKLQVLQIQESEVTDDGLGVLFLFTNLRVINIQCCPVSDDGLNKLLDIHKKLEEYNVGDCYSYQEDTFSILSRSISLVCPSMKRFALKSNPVTDAHLTSVVTLFPNLTYLVCRYQITGDLCILKDLKYLTELRFACSSGNFSLQNLKQLLTIIGENISVLIMQRCSPEVGLTQEDVNFIFNFCGNIEHLQFDYQPPELEEKLIIPPFKKLKILRCISINYYNDEDSRVRLEFGEMLKLEYLIIKGFDRTFHTIESIMLDNVRFPKLKEVGELDKYDEHTNRILEIAKNNNLDFSIILLD